MGLEDEGIMNKRIKAKSVANRDVENAIALDGVFYQFIQKELFDKKMSILLPADFEPMKDEDKKRKYPSEYRPQVVIGNSNGTVVFSFSYFLDTIYTDEVFDCILGFKAIVKKMSPANTFYAISEISIGESRVGYCEYQSYAIDDDIFNVIFVTPICDKLMLGAFSCSMKSREKWESVVHDVMRSIKEQREEL